MKINYNFKTIKISVMIIILYFHLFYYVLNFTLLYFGNASENTDYIRLNFRQYSKKRHKYGNHLNLYDM